jgi:hypothetical protein
VIVMDAKNWADLREIRKASQSHAVLLEIAVDDSAANPDVIDPVDLDESAMRGVARHLGKLIDRLIGQIKDIVPVKLAPRSVFTTGVQ